MKITLDVSKLVREGKLSKEDAARLLTLAKQTDTSHAFWILAVLATIAVVVGFVGLNYESFLRIANSLYTLLGVQGLHLLALMLVWTGAYITKSGFLAGISAFIILSLLGGSTFYSHAAYFVAIREPALTVLIFSGLAIVSLKLSKKLEYADERLTIIFSRTCLIIVNMGFWIGSLWGSSLGADGRISRLVFVTSWAIGLLAVGFWGAREGRRFVVNTAAVFGSIHFYTQWFERRGASPGSLMLAGLMALGIIFGLRTYNRDVKARS